ncbi:MAG: hypothetical protein R3C97_01705 [Geminicoccaceae bacterium]
MMNDALDAAPGPVRFWLRDDDASSMTPQLARLLDIADHLDMPMALAVIPARLQADAADSLASHAQAVIMQHGFDHSNHALPGEKKRELGGTLTTNAVLERLRAGRAILERMCHRRVLPVLVPPWNRIDDEVVAALPDLGFQGLSTFASDGRGECAGLVQHNPQIDPIAWRTDRAFLSAPAIVDRIVELIRAGSIRR